MSFRFTSKNVYCKVAAILSFFYVRTKENLMKLGFVISLLLVVATFNLAAEEVSFLKPNETDRYHRTVDSIAYRTKGDKTNVRIQLSDLTTWNFTVDSSEEYLLADLEKDFIQGKEVLVNTIEGTPYYWLRIETNEGKAWLYRVGMTKETKQMLPEIVNIEKIKISEGGWFSSSVYVYYISLSDGSKWQLDDVRHWKALDQWGKGDSIIVTINDMYEDRWYLINANSHYNSYEFPIDHRSLVYFSGDGAVNLVNE